MPSPKMKKRRGGGNISTIYQKPIPIFLWIITFCVFLVFIRFSYKSFTQVSNLDLHERFIAEKKSVKRGGGMAFGTSSSSSSGGNKEKVSIKNGDVNNMDGRVKQVHMPEMEMKDSTSNNNHNIPKPKPGIRNGQNQKKDIVHPNIQKNNDNNQNNKTNKIQPLHHNHIEAAIDDMHPKQEPNSKTNNDNNNNNNNNNNTDNLPKTLTLTTSQGPIHIHLRPDLSLPSIQYISALLQQSSKPCKRCSFYRAEKPGILQGILVKEGVTPNKVLGECPEEYREESKEGRDCPKHDPNCGCHGPVMERGMVGWAAGKGGPDFFIDMYKRKADWWHNEHTIWGQVIDPDSLKVIEGIFELPTKKTGLTYLTPNVPIEIE